MKINNIGTSGINPYKRNQDKIEQVSKMPSKGRDKVEISSAAKEMQHLSQIEQAREKMVQELKQKVTDGSYKPNPQDIAQGMYNYFKKN